METSKTKRFRQISGQIADLYEKKNADYGDSFGETFGKLGIISPIYQITENFNLLCRLYTNERKVQDGSLEGTLRELAYYSIMMLIELESKENTMEKINNNQKASLNQLRDEAYATACEHGFHEQKHSSEHLLMLVITEMSEAVQADRKGLRANMKAFDYWKEKEGDGFKDKFSDVYKSCISGTVEDELSDIVIRLLDIAGLCNIDLEYAECLLTKTKGFFIEDGISLTEFMFRECKEITEEVPLDIKINYVVAEIIHYAKLKLDTDLYRYIDLKMKYNKLRPYLNGKKY